MLAALALLLSIAALALGAALAVRVRRAGAERRELGRQLYESALGLDRRCDFLTRRLDSLAARHEIDHLATLVRLGEESGRLDRAVAERLRRFVLELYDEAEALPVE